VDAIVSGLAPGNAAETESVGYSTGGRSLTGSVGEQPENQQRRHKQRRRHRTPDEKVAEIHRIT
jgi:hypothetical protein